MTAAGQVKARQSRAKRAARKKAAEERARKAATGEAATESDPIQAAIERAKQSQRDADRQKACNIAKRGRLRAKGADGVIADQQFIIPQGRWVRDPLPAILQIQVK